MSKHPLACHEPSRHFDNGLRLSATKTAGEIPDGVDKAGAPLLVAYDAGAAVLHDALGTVHAGPIDATGAEALAIAIVEGKPRAATAPGAALRLAIAYLALTDGAGHLLRERALLTSGMPPLQAERPSRVVPRPVRSEAAEGRDSARTK